MTRFGLATALCVAALAVAAPAWGAPPPPGIVAAYSFDEGSGSVAVDASGNGHAGAISGASWTTGGRYGGALSFDGSNDSVGLGSLGTFYQGGFTLQAWVQKTTSKNDVAVVGTWAGSGPMLWVDHLASRYHLTLDGGLSSYLDSGQNPVLATWQHLAATYDGTTARFYVDGTQVASRAVGGGAGSSDVWRIGAYGGSPGGFFDGLIDDVRIYNRALTATEIQSDMATPVTIANSDIPTDPGSFVVTVRTKTSLAVQWSPSTDDEGVTGYRLFLNGSEATTTSGTTHTFAGLSCSTSYELGVEAMDGDGNVSARVLTDESTSLCQGALGLVAAYSFDQGSGTTAVDESGNDHAGAIVGAAWTSGRHGSALSFDGSDDHVALGSLGSFSQTAFTLQAWVQKATSKKDVAVVGSWTGNGPMLWVDHIAGNHHLTLAGGMGDYLNSGQAPTTAEWQHVAATYDGTTARYYVDGAQVASRSVNNGPGASDTWRIGAYGGSPGGFFDGVIDDVRIYNRALSATEIQTDKNQPVPPEDATPPSAPGSLYAAGAVEQATLSWGAATDDVQLARYNVHRSTSAGFTPSPANRIAQPTGTTYADTGLAPGTYYYVVTGEDGNGNVGPPSNQASATAAPDSTPPTVAVTSPAGGSGLSGPITVTANANDDQVVAGVQFKLDGQNLGAEDTAAPYSLAWDTRGEFNGAHTITAVAHDGAGNTTTSGAVAVTVTNPPVSDTGLRAAYGLDDGSGTIVRDSSESHQTGTLTGGWATGGRFGGAVSLNGSTGKIDLPALGTFYKTAFTYEAWVFKQSSKKDVAVLGSWVGSQFGGAMIWIDHANGRYHLTLGHNPGTYLDSGQTAAVGQWQHIAATYDGSIARIYVDGVQTASTPFSGNVGNSNTWRIGAYGATATGFFDGLIDNVRIYERALSGAEIQTDLASRIQPDLAPPTVTSFVPAGGATSIGVGESVTVQFDEPMDAATITTSAFELTDDLGGPTALAVSYNQSTNVATLALQGALEFGTTYEATVKAGIAKDLAGNPIASEVNWSFTTETSPPPVLLATSPANPFGAYLGEILRNEGLTDFTKLDAALVTPSLLSHFDVVVLGESALTATQVSTLSAWVQGGGNLIAMRPDKQLAGLLGLTDAAATLANAYLQVDTSPGPGAGIVGETVQFHGTADRYSLNGATAVATLYSTTTTATTSPAVTLRSVGASGGEAAAFTFDLARSVVYTRQGNPAWASQERDGSLGIRPSDMFYGAKPGDIQPDWVDTSRISIPQADEQQRLLLNLITQMNADKKPLPRFWYLPRGEKAVVVMSGDDHSTTQAPGGTGSHFDRYLELSPAGCVVAEWECVRATSYVYPGAKLTDVQAGLYLAAGFETALHPVVQSCPAGPISAAELAALYDTQLAAFHAKYASQPSPISNRTHCVYWPDWASNAKVELARGIRLDGNYYHYPGAWIGATPGFMNGGGFPMRFADLDGTLIDVYQQNTNLTDESTSSVEASVTSLLDKALGPEGYYGAFGANMHTDDPAPHSGSEAIIEAAQARDVPVISYKQMLDWVDGRNSSSIRELSWNAGTLTFAVTAGTGANGLQAMLPVQGPAGTLSALTRGGSPVAFTVQTVKGIDYAMFPAGAGAYAATYN